jgi:HKD family nuclease
MLPRFRAVETELRPTKRCSGRDVDLNVQLLTPDARGAYLECVQHDIECAEYFVLVTAFATSDGITLLEPAMRTCLEAGGQGTLVLALDRQHFNAAAVFEKLASLAEAFPNKLEVRIVPERAGLLHAKAVFAKRPDGSATLLVGSANLTERAFTQNHELGLWVDLLGAPQVSRTFQLFAQSLGGTRHDAADLRRLAGHIGIAPHVVPPDPRPEPPLMPWVDPIASGPGAAMPPISIETFVGDWLQAGNIVRRGRRGLEVLVIRTPREQLEYLGLIESKRGKMIGRHTKKTVSRGYSVRLLPDEEDERLRKDSRRTWSILGKLTLDLPCFGRWMPKTYWELLQQATAQVQAADISTEAIIEAAARRRRELEGDGIEREVNAIVADLQSDEIAKAGREDDLRAALLSHFRAQLAERTPDLLARAIGIRTGLLPLTSGPDRDLRGVARSFFVDLVQSTFAATYRTGVWPKRFRSFVGRELATRIAVRLVSAGEEPSDDLAFRLLDGTARWEDERVDFETVTTEVNKLLGDPSDFAPVTIDELLHVDQEGVGDTDDD